MGIRSDLLAATRRNIVDAAMNLFIERGIAGTKMEDILSSAGVSVGSFYYLFKNKTDLAASIYLETRQQLFESLLSELSNHTDASAKEGIQALLQTYMQWSADHPKEMYYLVICRDPEIRNDERERASESEYYGKVVGWLQPFMEQGELRPLTPQLCLALLFGPADHVIWTALDLYGVNDAAGDTSENHQLIDSILRSVEPLTEAIWQALKKSETNNG